MGSYIVFSRTFIQADTDQRHRLKCCSNLEEPLGTDLFLYSTYIYADIVWHYKSSYS
jgi:hypothetical protein